MSNRIGQQTRQDADKQLGYQVFNERGRGSGSNGSALVVGDVGAEVHFLAANRYIVSGSYVRQNLVDLGSS